MVENLFCGTFNNSKQKNPKIKNDKLIFRQSINYSNFANKENMKINLLVIKHQVIIETKIQ